MIKLQEFYSVNKNNPKFLSKISFYSLFIVFYSVLPTYASICLIISYITGKRFLKIQLSKQTLLSLLPHKIKEGLTKRSIFDLLCDVWFVPKFSLYIKAFLKPFVSNIEPENAEQALNELPEEDKQIITKKGILTTLPQLLSTVDTTQQLNESEITLKTPKKCKEKKNRFERNKQINRTKSKRIFKEDKLISTFKMPWTIVKSYEDDRISILSSQSDIDYSNKRNISIIEEMKQLPTIEQTIGCKTIDIVLKPQNSQEQIKWDNLDNFYNQVKDTVPGQHKRPLEVIMKITNLINNLVRFEKRSKQVLAIDNNTLFKAFLMSAAALAFQSYISSKTRKLMMQTMMIICYLGSAGIATGTIGLFVVKVVRQRNRKIK